MTDRRILFAEFMGWYRVTDPDSMTQLGVAQPCYGDEVWVKPDHSDWVWPEALPNPENNDTDCMALVRALNDAGYAVLTYHWSKTHHGVEFRSDTSRFASSGNYRKPADGYWTGDDWKQGVCDLAEKILNEQQRSD